MISSRLRGAAVGLALALSLPAGPVAAAAAQTPGPVPPAEDRRLGRDLLAMLIGIDSTHAHGSTVIAKALAARLLGAGFAPADVQVLIPDGHPDKGNLVVRLRGRDRAAKATLWIGHLDVVEAPREDWTYDPFQLTEAGGWLYGRGTIDMKGQDAAVAEALIRLRREAFMPRRDIVVTFTADEESGGEVSGVDWLLKTHRALIDADLVINPDMDEGGLKHGRRLYLPIETSEKVYETYQIEAVDKGGHSSMPGPGNPIYRMARALSRLEAQPFPVDLTDTVRAYFRARAALESGQVRADMVEAASGAPSSGAVERLSAVVETNVLLRTTCVATTINGGQGESALPERVRALIQCRVIPGEDLAGVRQALRERLGDPEIALTDYTAEPPTPESPLSPTVLDPVREVVEGMWPGTPILPIMSAGASDSAITRAAGIASYGLDGIFGDMDDDRAHGRDERVAAQAFDEELEFTYRLMKSLGDRR
jgi:acetylornithine deacetylase/succinyl-diaminopimelate desuccinylase-like protein